MNILKQSTAVDVLIGPFVDSTDGYTAETGLSPAVKLSKNGQTLAAKNDATTPVHDADGYYNCELDATDTNTVGTLVLTVVGSATSLPVRHEFQVMEEVSYDALFGTATSLLTSLDVGLIYEGAISTVNSQTSFDMDTAIATDDIWIGNQVTISDAGVPSNVWVTHITDVDQANDRIIIADAAPFTVATSDVIRVFRESVAYHTAAELATYGTATNAKLLSYTKLLARKDSAVATDEATSLGEINENGGSGEGTYDNATDSLEANQDDITTVDTVADAVKAKTDQLTFSTAGFVDANIMEVNDNGGLTGDGDATPVSKA